LPPSPRDAIIRSWWPPEAGCLAGSRYREIARRLEAPGFQFDRQAAGSHEIWNSPAADRYTTIPNHPGDMPEGTLRAILKQEEIDPDAFLVA
jgi:predicted RNA binding protein YcfA (HicA-like mRNA interferase family)